MYRILMVNSGEIWPSKAYDIEDQCQSPLWHPNQFGCSIKVKSLKRLPLVGTGQRLQPLPAHGAPDFNRVQKPP